jgi:hypothetical protein
MENSEESCCQFLIERAAMEDSEESCCQFLIGHATMEDSGESCYSETVQPNASNYIIQICCNNGTAACCLNIHHIFVARDFSHRSLKLYLSLSL